MITIRRALFFVLLLAMIRETRAQNSPGAHPARTGKLVTATITSKILQENRIGISTDRKIKIYLPPGYENSGRYYPVVYFLHSIFSNNDVLMEDGKVTTLIDRAWMHAVIGEFIFVVPDYRTATTGSLYDNSPVSGRWLDYTTEEVIPYVDQKFRTMARKENRAVVGEFMGGRGALKLAMTRPDIFSVVYALNPVATGMGKIPWSYTQIDWKKLHTSTTYPDNSLDGISQIFLMVSQTYLPNLNRPPYYCDFFMEPDNGKFKPNVVNMIKAQRGFSIGETIYDYADQLKSLKGVALDWARFDPIHAHIDSNRELSRKLEDLGIAHEAEEYSGAPFEKTWLDDGRFYLRVLPFLARKMDFGTR
ncbi:hypothetical protein DYBT9275_05909 [Dyadobacter sp. CECT 9275]|uniref:Esterase n=1 Tax=Dyadobacter helix TaxID=2822344 RepID=A0A916JIC9_9BACT|nr:alpha/beta hydrolase-fold protein [Dyadobacter sp. CECT 9275]CAG5018056.1 hypothetical protein DYBT9275_05909 [Dyadobacter sp. CECT 9275]